MFRRLCVVATMAWVVLPGPCLGAQQAMVTTVAGTGTAGFSEDGVLATQAMLNWPTNVWIAPDGSGEIYIGDALNHRVRKIDGTSGALVTVAGNGTSAFSGDGGLATEASLSRPMGICRDAAGNLYIGDSWNHRVRRVDAQTGIIATIAGNGSGAAFSGANGPATEASIIWPLCIFLDEPRGWITFAANRQHYALRLALASGALEVVAGTGDSLSAGDDGSANLASIMNPVGVFGDPDGNLYITESTGHRIRRVDAQTGIITTIAGNGTPGFSGDGGPARDALIKYPVHVVFDRNGNLYFTDGQNNRIRRIDARSSIITTVAGNGTAAYAGDGGDPRSASFSFPAGMSIDTRNDVLYVGDANNHCIRMVQLDPITAVEEAYSSAVPSGFALAPNHPNPFNSSTVIRFSLPVRAPVALAVYDLAGQRVANLVQGVREAGEYSVAWDGTDAQGRALASGVYLYQLRAGGQAQARPLLLLR